jgi:hypothetical protein
MADNDNKTPETRPSISQPITGPAQAGDDGSMQKRVNGGNVHGTTSADWIINAERQRQKGEKKES